ncbi:MAG: choice-of-anchor Q domain-containing protein [Planctomycetota bacterium]
MTGTEDDNFRLSPSSPAIGAGDPAYVPDPVDTDLDGNPRLEGCRVDMGAYEAVMEQLPGDFDANRRIDLADLAAFQLCMGASIVRPDWLDTCLCLFDADQSGDVDLYDFAAFHALLTGQ